MASMVKRGISAAIMVHAQHCINKYTDAALSTVGTVSTVGTAFWVSEVGAA